MKRTVLIIMLCSCVFTVWSQPSGHFRKNVHHISNIEHITAKNAYQYKLASFHTNDMYQFNDFYYNSLNQLVAVKDSVRDDYSVIDSLFYNERGQMIRMSGWQLLNGTWENVYRIDYTYDQAGNIASRTNYNNFDGEWELGGVYQYTYNADNQKILSVLTMSGIQFQKVEYTYSDGLLSLELWYSYNGSGLSPDEKLSYTYNADNQLSQINDSVSDGNGGWLYFGRHDYFYDNNGNCTEHHYYDQTGMEAERSIYQFIEDRSLNETLMPWTPEMTRPKTYTNSGVYHTEQWYSVDVDHVLRHVCDFIYHYTENTNRICDIASAPLGVAPNPANGVVTIHGLSDIPTKVRIINGLGREVMKSTLNSASNQLNVASLPSGCYTILVDQQGSVRATQLIVE